MSLYKIHYIFDGQGYCQVEASSPEEAKQLFFDGQFDHDKDTSENYSVERITLLPTNK